MGTNPLKIIDNMLLNKLTKRDVYGIVRIIEKLQK